MRHRPTEIKEVTAMLEQDWDDTETLAQAILDRLVEIKWARNPYVVVMRDPNALPAPILYGPYTTPTQARKDVGRRIQGVSDTTVAQIHPVTNLDAVEEIPEGLLLF